MNSGSFFHLDLETSKVVNGVTFYEYTDLPDLSGGNDIIRYPVRLSISPDNVTFFIHYYCNSGKDGSVFLPLHSEEVILDLPYNSSDPEALSSVIKRVYNTVFPLSDYLRHLVSKRYIDTQNEYSHLQSSQVNKDTYSSLSIWGLIKDVKDGKIKYNIQDNNGKEVTGFLRKLLLDFMFDFMHSDVFESSKYYPQMRERLMSDFFFSAIVKKCEYYYNRRLIRNRFRDIRDDSKYLIGYSRLIRKRQQINNCKIIKKRLFAIERTKNRIQNRIDNLEQDIISFSRPRDPKVFKSLENLINKEESKKQRLSESITLNEEKIRRINNWLMLEPLFSRIHNRISVLERNLLKPVEQLTPEEYHVTGFKIAQQEYKILRLRKLISRHEKMILGIKEQLPKIVLHLKNKVAKKQARIARLKQAILNLSEGITPEEYHAFGFIIAKQEYKKLRLRKRLAKQKERIKRIDEFLGTHYETNSVLELIKKLYAAELDDSESVWIDTIMSPMAEKHFSFSPEWFEDKKPRKKHNRFSVSESWFVNPEEEMARIVFPLETDEKKSRWKIFVSDIKCLLSNKNEPEKIHYLNSFELSELFWTENKSSVLDRNTKISKWFYRRFDFVDAFRIHLFQHWNHVFAFFLLAFGVVAMIPGFWECPRNLALFPLTAAFGFLLTSIVSARLVGRQNDEKIDDILVKRRRTRECWKAFRLSVLFLAIWAFLFCYKASNGWF